jgi:hypothetical protein
MTESNDRAGELPDAASLLALLVAGDRLPVVAALVLGATTLSEIAERASLPARDVLRVLTRLESAGLASVDGDVWTLHVDVLREVVTTNRWPTRDTAPASGDASPQTATVLRAFFRGDRLLRVPTQRNKRLVVLDFLARDFEPGRRYDEDEVNEKLSARHPDYAALRRYLVDEGFLARESGVYWRTGGTVDV